MLATAQAQWLDVCDYLARVQSANSDEEEAQLAAELPQLEGHLDTILGALLSERAQMELDIEAHRHHHDDVSRAQGRQPSLASLTSSALLLMDRGGPSGLGLSPSSTGMWSFADTGSTVLSTPHTNVTRGGLEDDQPVPPPSSDLPPCYHYFFAAEPDSDPPSPLDSPLNDTLASEPDSSRSAAADMTMASVFPDTVGPTFFLTLCLSAKHNHPPGLRTVILRFLQDLIQRADLPAVVCAQGRSSSGKASGGHHLHLGSSHHPPRSILQLSVTAAIVPVLDMIRRVGAELDPTHPLTSAPVVSASGDAERTAFVRFLCALTERMEQVPDLANYFVTTRPSVARGRARSPGSAGTSVDSSGLGDGGPPERLELLEVLLPYMTHDCTAPGWDHRRDTCRYALSAVLSLAKCPDPWVQNLVGKETAITDRTLAAACTTLLTLCKIPDNDDSEVQLLYLRDVLRFWSAMCLAAPAVADALGLISVVESDFAQTALASLFMSHDSRVYSGACLVTASLLAGLNSSGPVIPSAMARAVLEGLVDMDTGRRHRKNRGMTYYDYMAAQQQHGGGGDDDRDTRLGSFFEYYVLSHLTTQPTFTEVDEASEIILSFRLSEWTAVEATLALLKALAENCPCLFARHALLTDTEDVYSIRTLATTAAALTPDGELSAASSAPPIIVPDLFSAQLRSIETASGHEEVCGVTSAELADEVFEAMLRIETNAPTNALYELQRAVSAPLPGGTSPAAAAPAAAAKDTQRRGSPWFHAMAASAPLTKVLCNLMFNFTDIPFRSAILLTDVCVRVCLLPDLRVLYTLLDPSLGPLAKALQQLRQRVDRKLNEIQKLNVTGESPAAAAGTGATIVTRADLYKLYLRHWSHMPTHILSSLSDERDTRGLAVMMEGTTSAMEGSSAGGGGGAAVSVAVLKSLIRHQQFLEACACLGQFRMELSAAVSCMTLSHGLMALKM